MEGLIYLFGRCNMINLTEYLLGARDPETYVALAVEDLISKAGVATLHTTGEPSIEYLGMLSLYAIRRASNLFTEGMPYYKLVRHAYDSFDPDHMSDRLIRCLTDLLSSESEEAEQQAAPTPSFEELRLSSATQNSLISIGLFSVPDLLRLSRNELSMIRNLGDNITDEIASALYRQGYKNKAVDLAFPGSTVKEIEKALKDSTAVFSLNVKGWLCNRLYRNGVRTLSYLNNMSVEELAELKGISYNDILEISAAMDELQ